MGGKEIKNLARNRMKSRSSKEGINKKDEDEKNKIRKVLRYHPTISLFASLSLLYVSCKWIKRSIT